MTAATLIKRIGTQRKEIARYRKEIARYEKDYLAKGCPEHMKAEGKKWIEYYEKHIKRVEDKIAEMSKEAAKLATEEEQKQMIKDMAEDMAKNGINMYHGLTTKGLKYSLYWNQGMTERSRHCYTMYIEGKGMVFTSGSVEAIAEYILKN